MHSFVQSKVGIRFCFELAKWQCVLTRKLLISNLSMHKVIHFVVFFLLKVLVVKNYNKIINCKEKFGVFYGKYNYFLLRGQISTTYFG